MTRVLITGSRDWTDRETIAGALIEANDDLGDFTLVHGAAAGADNIAAEIHHNWRGDVESHPANWRPYGIYNPQAGLARNRKMVELGADLCLAFIKNGSRGATHCADMAEAAGIETRRWYA